MAPLPTSRSEARAVVYRLYQQTLQELPEGFALDGTRYGDTGETVVPCDDNHPQEEDHAPATYSDWRDMVTPYGADYDQLIAKIGEIWRGWGWRVVERNGFNKPNRFGYAPDGYQVRIEAANPIGYPPTVVGSSPCFPGDAVRFQSVPTPRVITRDGPQYDQPSLAPTPTR